VLFGTVLFYFAPISNLTALHVTSGLAHIPSLP